MTRTIRTVELVAWGLDGYGFRPGPPDDAKVDAAERVVAAREQYCSEDALCAAVTELLREELERQRSRPDLLEEMDGLKWSPGVVDLGRLLAFQRRLSFGIGPGLRIPAQADWSGLLTLAFAAASPVVCTMRHDPQARLVTIRSENPNVHLRVTRDPSSPIAVHGGSPFLEVAEYRGRWFLRDGYHRAARLLEAGVLRVPAVIVRARSLAELGAVGSQFFGEEVLFGERPPRVSDFLDPALTVDYERPATVTTLRVRMEEFVMNEISEQEPEEQA